ncbi:hypothetical protein IP88_13970 [alpha proteobacterium AAP81b]|nr:hypothetical protein IP88_13970 [alpha proteobacterium AAP81b]
MTEIAAIARDPLWFPHRFDPGQATVHFRRFDRDTHREATFITDEYLPAGDPTVIRLADAMAARPAAAPLHFVFHSAFCCSTVLARAFDLPGAAMGLKEPVFLNDLVGWQHRGGSARDIAPVLDAGLTLLARPFGRGEAVVIKPSNVCNGLAPAMLTMRSAARALLLYAPLPVFLGSIAKKEMTGRLWARDLLVKQLRERLHPFGYTTDDYLGQTDLQAAAMTWLAQQALFAHLVATFGPRVRSLDSDRLMAEPVAAMRALAALYGIALDAEAVVAGPAFTTHSKSGDRFGSEARAAENAAAATAHRDEIDKVVVWTEAVAKATGVPMTPGNPLLG